MKWPSSHGFADGATLKRRSSPLGLRAPVWGSASSYGPRSAGGRAAYLLLDVVVSTALLVLGLATIGAQIQKSHFRQREMELQTRAYMLAESKLAELDVGLIDVNLEKVDDEIEEEFGRLFPYYGWRIHILPTATQGLNLVIVDILYKPRDYERDEFDFDEAEQVHRLYTFRVVPRPVDLVADFGMEEEQVEDLGQLFSDAGVNIDLDNFNISEFFRSADLEQIVSLAQNEKLMNALGISISDLKDGLPAEYRRLLLEALGSGAADGGDEGGDEP